MSIRTSTESASQTRLLAGFRWSYAALAGLVALGCILAGAIAASSPSTIWDQRANGPLAILELVCAATIATLASTRRVNQILGFGAALVAGGAAANAFGFLAGGTPDYIRAPSGGLVAHVMHLLRPGLASSVPHVWVYNAADVVLIVGASIAILGVVYALLLGPGARHES